MRSFAMFPALAAALVARAVVQAPRRLPIKPSRSRVPRPPSRIRSTRSGSPEYQKRDPEYVSTTSRSARRGIRQVTERTVDFGASDAPMTDQELAKAKAKLIHIPTTLGAVVVAFNLPGIDRLTLSPDVVAGLFLGEITSWNDPRLASRNPGVTLRRRNRWSPTAPTVAARPRCSPSTLPR